MTKQIEGICLQEDEGYDLDTLVLPQHRLRLLSNFDYEHPVGLVTNVYRDENGEIAFVAVVSDEVVNTAEPQIFAGVAVEHPALDDDGLTPTERANGLARKLPMSHGVLLSISLTSKAPEGRPPIKVLA